MHGLEGLLLMYEFKEHSCAKEDEDEDETESINNWSGAGSIY